MSTNKRTRKWYPFIYRVIYRVFTSTFGWGTHLVFGHRSRWLENRFYALVVCVCVCLFQDCQQSPLFVFCFYFVSLLFDAPTRPARDRSGRNESDRLTRSGLDARQDWTTISTEISRSQHELNALHFTSSPTPFAAVRLQLRCFVPFRSALFCLWVESSGMCGLIAAMPSCALDWRKQATDSHHRVLVMFMGSTTHSAHTVIVYK